MRKILILLVLLSLSCSRYYQKREISIIDIKKEILSENLCFNEELEDEDIEFKIEEDEIKTNFPEEEDGLCSLNIEEVEKKKEKVKYDVPIILNEKVKFFINYFLSSSKRKIRRWFERFTKFEKMMREIFKRYNLPQDLVYLSLIESGCNPKARSRAGAVGIWQFIRSTARKYGLKINYWYDERRDPEKSTIAAAKYLKDLYKIFNSWELAIAAYNVGEKRILRAIRKQKTKDFWKLKLPRETRNYLPAFMAIVVISKKKDEYGLFYKTLDPYEYEKVKISKSISLTVLAKCCGVSTLKLLELNPELKRRRTPPWKYWLKIPKGRKRIFLANLRKFYKRAKKTRRGKFKKIIYLVRRGDTLWDIALRYNVPIWKIRRWNNIRGNLIHPGKKIKIYLRRK